MRLVRVFLKPACLVPDLRLSGKRWRRAESISWTKQGSPSIFQPLHPSKGIRPLAPCSSTEDRAASMGRLAGASPVMANSACLVAFFDTGKKAPGDLSKRGV